MNELSVYIKTIVTVILLKPIVCGILPGEKMAKYINFTIGLMIITLVITPFCGEKPFSVFDFEQSYERQNYSELNINRVKQVFTEKMQSELNNKFGVDDVVITVDDNLNITSVSSKKQMIIKEYLGL